MNIKPASIVGIPFPYTDLSTRNIGAWLVQYSTDYVFDGSGDKAWQEQDEPRPINRISHSSR